MFPRLFILLLLPVLLLALSASGVPQNAPVRYVPEPIPDAEGGAAITHRNTMLVIHIVLPNNRSAGPNIGVTLESAHGGMVGQCLTNSSGEARFRGILPGNYVARVSGGNVKDGASQTIEILPADNYRSEVLRVDFLNFDGKQTVSSTQGSVSAAALNVPEAAKKERDKGNEAFSKGDGAKAKEHYLKAIELYPRYASAYNNLGTVYITSADRTHAREAWTKAVEIDPGLDSANVNLARLDFQERDYAGAITPLERALAVKPKNPDVLLLMSEAQLMTSHFAEALTYAHKLLELEHKQYEIAHIVAGRALELQNHPDQARTEYENLLKDAPAAPEAAEAKKSLARLKSPPKAQ